MSTYYSSSDESDSDVASSTPVNIKTQTNNNNNGSSSNSNTNSNTKQANRSKNNNSNKKKKDDNWNKVTIRLNAQMTRQREIETEEMKKRINKYSARRHEHWQTLRMNQRNLDIIENLPKSLYNDWVEYPYLSALSVRTRIADKSIKINLKRLAMSLPNTIYDPSSLDAVSVELMNPNCKVSVYSTGALNISGCRSVISGMYGMLCYVFLSFVQE